jgi:uncharacterized membrane protein YphA (DoxX/SURF4 family)
MDGHVPYGITIIRVGLSGVLLWFGANQLIDVESWIGYVPEFVPVLLGIPAGTLVLANGAIEIASGILLLLGAFSRIVAFVMGVHLVLIAASLGNTAVAVRDWGLAAALIGLVFTGAGAWSVDR